MEQNQNKEKQMKHITTFTKSSQKPKQKDGFDAGGEQSDKLKSKERP